MGALKKFGVAETTLSKKPCLCQGGDFDRRVGLLQVLRDGESYSYECVIFSFFSSSGSISGFGNCVAAGGTFEVLSK